jgi:hypothetical protein
MGMGGLVGKGGDEGRLLLQFKTRRAQRPSGIPKIQSQKKIIKQQTAKSKHQKMDIGHQTIDSKPQTADSRQQIADS